MIVLLTLLTLLKIPTICNNMSILSMLVWRQIVWGPGHKVRGLIREGEFNKHFREQALHSSLISFSINTCVRRKILWYPFFPLAVLEVAPDSLQLSLCKFAAAWVQ